MGNPNYLKFPIDCQNCGAACENPLQFDFGVQMDHLYSLGDRVNWDGPYNSGYPGIRRAAVSGWGFPCNQCHQLPQGTSEFVITIENDIFVKAEANLKNVDFTQIDWHVLEE